jgi:hypothetical protein
MVLVVVMDQWICPTQFVERLKSASRRQATDYRDSITRSHNDNLKFDFSQSRYYLLFRFKDLDGYMELYPEVGDDNDKRYSLGSP